MTRQDDVAVVEKIKSTSHGSNPAKLAKLRNVSIKMISEIPSGKYEV